MRFLRNVARGESEAGVLGTAKKKASEIKLTLVRNRLAVLNVLNGICVFMVSFLVFRWFYLSAFKFGSEKAIGRLP
jgi:hypothetical protein